MFIIVSESIKECPPLNENTDEVLHTQLASRH